MPLLHFAAKIHDATIIVAPEEESIACQSHWKGSNQPFGFASPRRNDMLATCRGTLHMRLFWFILLGIMQSVIIVALVMWLLR
jgi:hypothetical protein